MRPKKRAYSTQEKGQHHALEGAILICTFSCKKQTEANKRAVEAIGIPVLVAAGARMSLRLQEHICPCGCRS
eukprot:scaffold265841_cov22-Tisochrysis_lutea.AAC.1